MITALSGDTSRLRATVDFVKEQDTATLLRLLLPGLDGPELRALVERCDFSHAALLVFPPDEAALDATLADCGLVADAPPRPSVVVRERLAVRHKRCAAELDVGILRPAVECLDGARRWVEVFALTVPPGADLDTVAAHERERQHEAHVAFEVEAPDPLVLRGLCAVFGRYGATPTAAATTRTRTARCSTSPRPPRPRPGTGAWSCTSPATTATSSPPTSTSTVSGSPPRPCCAC